MMLEHTKHLEVGSSPSSLAGLLAVAFDLAAMGPVRTPVGGRDDICKMCRKPNVSGWSLPFCHNPSNLDSFSYEARPVYVLLLGQ